MSSPPSPPSADDQLRALRATWEGDLFGSVMPFWMTHSIDEEHGGFFTCLDNDGSCYDETKYAWLQGRQVYTLSRLYNEVRPSSEDGGGGVGAAHGVTAETRAAWLRGAAAGARFLDCAKDEAGLLFFSTSRDGRSRLHLQRKPYSAVFYVLGLLEFWKALRTHAAEGGGVLTEAMHGVTLGPDEAAVDAAYLGKSMAMFDELARWIDDPSLCGRPAPNVPPGDAAAAGDPGETRLADVMCMASLALDFLRHLAGTPQDTAARREQYLGLIRAAMANCERHYDTRGPGGGRKVFLETCSGAGLSSATPAGRMFNPGHSIEVAWFLLLMCDAVPGGSARHEELALAVLQGSLEAGWDDAAHGGGLLYVRSLARSLATSIFSSSAYSITHSSTRVPLAPLLVANHQVHDGHRGAAAARRHGHRRRQAVVAAHGGAHRADDGVHAHARPEVDGVAAARARLRVQALRAPRGRGGERRRRVVGLLPPRWLARAQRQGRQLQGLLPRAARAAHVRADRCPVPRQAVEGVPNLIDFYLLLSVRSITTYSYTLYVQLYSTSTQKD